jgi:hypothetical protein
MANRPIFLPNFDGAQLVREVSINFTWHSGMAPSQKQKNVAELHNEAAKRGLFPLLEVSTKSKEAIGQKLSAFNLQVQFSDLEIPFESAYQGSKVFERGGPFRDLYELAPYEAKKDERLYNSGSLIGFNFYGMVFPLSPKTAFYDWLYLHSLYRDREFLWEQMSRYRGFTDIEFNPEKSINCQARACAMFVSMEAKQILDDCMDSFDHFTELLTFDETERYRQRRATELRRA